MKRHTMNYLKAKGLYRAGMTEPPYIPCEECGKRPVQEIHHITPKGMGGRIGADEASNLRGLCVQCHAKSHGINVVDITGDERW